MGVLKQIFHEGRGKGSLGLRWFIPEEFIAEGGLASLLFGAMMGFSASPRAELQCTREDHLDLEGREKENGVVVGIGETFCAMDFTLISY